MKKIVILTLTLCMCLPLAACGEDDTFWTQTLSQFELILGSDETPKNEDLFLGAELTYSSNIENLRTGIEELSEEVSAFRTAKADFEKALEGIEAKDLYQSEITMQELKEYKRAFASLILKTSDVNLEFLNTYELS